MPSPRDQSKPERRARRQDTMPGGWLWIVVLLLLGAVIYITFGFPSTSSLDYSDFVKLVKDHKVARVILSEGSYSLIAEFDEKKVQDFDESIRKQIRNNRAEVVLRKGDVASGELSRMLDAAGVPRKTERSLSTWIGPISFGISTLLLMALIFFFFFLPRIRDPFGSSFLNSYIRSPAKRFDKTKQRTTFDDVADMTNAKFELQEI